jgi:hypothetical protein
MYPSLFTTSRQPGDPIPAPDSWLACTVESPLRFPLHLPELLRDRVTPLADGVIVSLC